jgi:hypothetical protein
MGTFSMNLQQSGVDVSVLDTFSKGSMGAGYDLIEIHPRWRHSRSSTSAVSPAPLATCKELKHFGEGDIERDTLTGESSVVRGMQQREGISASSVFCKLGLPEPIVQLAPSPISGAI